MTELESFQSQGEAVSSLIRQVREDRLPHALLINGIPGVGKWTLATGLAAALLCQGEEKKPCGQCPACLQMESLEHPDVIVIQKGVPLAPDGKKDRTFIPVDDIREMIRLTGEHAFESDRKVVLIRNGEDMNDSAQNSLLKNLEEPPAGVCFLITSAHPDMLLPTVISRCRPVRLHPWRDEDVLRILRTHNVPEDRARQIIPAAGGSPGEALRISEDENFWQFRSEVIQDFLASRQRSDILRVSNRWKERKGEANSLFSVLEQFMNQLMRVSLRVSGEDHLPEGCPDRWKQFAERASAEDYAHLFEGFQLARQRIVSSVNLQAVLEQVLFLLMEATSI